VEKLAITVYGRPAPQGSKKSIGNGRFIEASKYLPAWRKAVKDAAIAAKGEAETLTNGVQVSVSFYLERPKSVPKKSRPLPTVMPDLSKLVRGVEDALTDAGVWADDAQVVKMIAFKYYADDREPGCFIEVEPYVTAV
jgi:Holliday junction resolvase RusA-like endonuclease